MLCKSHEAAGHAEGVCLQDVAIAHGYNNLRWTVPQTVTIGSELPLNQLTELLRLECAMAGFTEILTWALCSHAENFGHLQRPDNGESAVSISNPATAEFEVCRTALLPGAPGTSETSSQFTRSIWLKSEELTFVYRSRLNSTQVHAGNGTHSFDTSCNPFHCVVVQSSKCEAMHRGAKDPGFKQGHTSASAIV